MNKPEVVKNNKTITEMGYSIEETYPWTNNDI